MDISINNNKYAKRDDVIRMAKVMDEELEKTENNISSLSYLVENVTNRLNCMSENNGIKDMYYRKMIAILTSTLIQACSAQQRKMVDEKMQKIKELDGIMLEKIVKNGNKYENYAKGLKIKYGVDDE